MKKLLWPLLAASVALSGCATTTAPSGLASADQQKLQGSSFVYTTHQQPSFLAMTADKAMLGMLGTVAMVSAGNTLVRNNNVEDPAVLITTELAKTLSEKRGMKNAGAVASDAKFKPSDLKDKAGTDVVLDVRTTGWNLLYFPTNWTHYKVMYGGQVRLLDAKTQKVLYAETCTATLDTPETAATYEELTSNSAALLKSKLATVANECVAKVKAGLNL